jgi:hypothetical protein
MVLERIATADEMGAEREDALPKDATESDTIESHAKRDELRLADSTAEYADNKKCQLVDCPPVDWRSRVHEDVRDECY